VLPKGPGYLLARRGIIEAPPPITLTFSVTAACQSLCKTCRIGERFLADPKVVRQNMTLEQVERAFASLGELYFLNISGGEPFMRNELPEIIELACRHLKPKLIHIPTNAISPVRIGRMTERIMEIVGAHDPKLPVSIKPSIDGLGERHDEIRGFPGNWARLLKTVKVLKEVESRFPALHVELGTVISRFNMDQLDELEDFVHTLGVESYRSEIAEQRAEFFNYEDPIVPDQETYERLIMDFAAKVERNIGNKRLMTRVFEAIRIEYYHLAVRIIKEQRQVIPCLGGISNVHLNYNGEVWPCCVLGYDKPLGHLHEHDFDMKALLRAPRARNARRFIADGGCACPLANQAFSNILFNPTTLARAGARAARFLVRRRG
jgi:MoaA/NifB/PqqE/SkfB family radical SAM enzyme